VNAALGVMNIRPGAHNDSKVLAELIDSFRPMLTLDPTGAGAEQYLISVSESAEREYLSSPRYLYLVAELEGRVVGFIAMRDRTHLFHLFVAAEHQGRGIARALWERAREQILRDGGGAVFTVNSSLSAVPVYKRFGFRPAGAEIQAHGIAFVPMRLELRNDA